MSRLSVGIGFGGVWLVVACENGHEWHYELPLLPDGVMRCPKCNLDGKFVNATAFDPADLHCLDE